MDIVAGFLLLFLLFLSAVILHELSHGFVALALGDRTAQQAGRLTLNPLKHVDPVGTIFLPLVLRLVHSPVTFGWAKPVPINVFNLRHPKRDMLWIGMAGPVSNLLMAIAASGFLKVFGPGLPPVVVSLVKYLALVNLVLGVFNLLPIPPLDGSRVLMSIVPNRFAVGLILMERWGFILVFLLLYLGWIDKFLGPMIEYLVRVLGL